MSPITKLKLLLLIYKYWLKDLIIQKIKKDHSYRHLLQFIDAIIHDDIRKDGDQWD